MLKEDNKRIRWLTSEQAAVLINELPEHLADMASFALATGLRAFNITGLQWSQMDLIKRHAWVHPDQAKAGKAIAVPLNNTAVSIHKQLGKHQRYIFTYRGKCILQCNTTYWISYQKFW